MVSVYQTLEAGWGHKKHPLHRLHGEETLSTGAQSGIFTAVLGDS